MKYINLVSGVDFISLSIPKGVTVSVPFTSEIKLLLLKISFNNKLKLNIER